MAVALKLQRHFMDHASTEAGADQIVRPLGLHIKKPPNMFGCDVLHSGVFDTLVYEDPASGIQHELLTSLTFLGFSRHFLGVPLVTHTE